MVMRTFRDSLFCLVIGPFFGVFALVLARGTFTLISGGYSELLDLSGKVPLILFFGYMYGVIPAFVGGLLFSLLTQPRLASLTRLRFVVLGGLCGIISTFLFCVGLSIFISLNEFNDRALTLKGFLHNLGNLSVAILIGAFAGLCSAWVLWNWYKPLEPAQK